MMRVVYVAGPFRGPNHWEIHQNIRRAETLALAVWRAGAAAICPHTNTIHFQDAAPDHVWLEGDLAIVAKCDAIIMTDDWQRSTGARAEHEFAAARGIPIFYTIDGLKEWLGG
jgi:nucleoside 2-deoxyribosyltransferase